MGWRIGECGCQSAAGWVALLLFCTLAGCSDESGPKTYPVNGSVLVNGTPTKGVVVTFQNLDRNAPGNAAHPVAVTDDAGKFALSTNADKDGAVEGDYVVIFFWASSNGPSAFDRFAGRFNNAEQSKFRVKVEAKPLDLEPFRIDIDPKLIRSVKEPSAAVQ